MHLILGPVHTGSQVPSHVRSIRAILVLESIKVQTYHFTLDPQVPSPKCDMDAYMAILFAGEARGKKLDPTLNTSPMDIFA